MRILFTFLIMASLCFALFGQNVIQVTEGLNQIRTAYLSAQPNDILELVTDGGIYKEDSTLKTTFPLTIRAAAGLTNKPVWEGAERHLIDIGDNLTLSGFKMTGMWSDDITDTKDSSKYAIAANDAGVVSGYTLSVDDVDFDFFTFYEDGENQGYVFRPQTAEYAKEIDFTNCTFTRVASYVLRFRNATVSPGQFGKLKLLNCTAADIGSYFARADLLPADGDTAQIRVNHCTFYDIGSAVLRMDPGTDIVVKNSIFVETGAIVDAPDAEVTYCDTMTTGGFNIDNESAVIENIYAEDPEFADPANFDFTVSEIFASIALGADGKVVGDPRWDPALTSIEEISSNPQVFALMQNYPNPFNPTTNIAYRIANAVDVKLTIFNVLGQEIIRLVDEYQKAGRYELLWDGHDTNGKLISSGIYFFRLQAGDFVKTHKMIFIK